MLIDRLVDNDDSILNVESSLELETSERERKNLVRESNVVVVATFNRSIGSLLDSLVLFVGKVRTQNDEKIDMLRYVE